MNFSFENIGNNTFLVLELPAEAEVDTLTLGMITNNVIPGVAPAMYTQVDDKKYVKYSVSAKITLKQYFSGPINKNKLLSVFSNIVSAVVYTDDYMIDSSSFLYSTEYIFVNATTAEVSMICVPLIGYSQEFSDAGALFKNLLFTSQFDYTENNDYIGRIIGYLNSSPVFVPADFKRALELIDAGIMQSAAAPVQQPVVQPVQQPVVQPAQQPVVQQPVVQPVQQSVELASAIPTIMNGMQISGKSSEISVVGTTKEKKGFKFFEKKEPKVKAEKTKKKAEKGIVPPLPNYTIPGMQTPPPPGVSQKGMPSMPGKTTAKAPMLHSAISQSAAPQQPVTTQPTVAQTSTVNQAVQQTVSQEAGMLPYDKIMQAATGIANNGRNFGETTVLGGGIGETTVLSEMTATNSQQPHLIRTKSKEKIYLDKPVFRIGKENSYVDYFVSDNTAVSRSHANIILRDGRVYIMDTNSTNHTFVNGKMIQSNVEVEITHGAKIVLANEEFEFKAY